MEEILRILPDKMKNLIRLHVANKWDQLEEIRLRLNHPVELNFYNHVEWLKGYLFSKKDSMYVLSQLSEHSLYRMEDELREGYMTIQGGHRVGLAGEVNTVDGKLKQLQHITFFNIRIAKEKIDLAKPYVSYLYDDNRYLNTLVIGAPQTGKTTFIRDIARLISEGSNFIFPKKVSIIDERSEIAASTNGIPQHNIGRRTDVMDACPKVAGMMMMIRSMSPEVLIVDEIGKEEDVQAVLEAVLAGVTVICTVHGSTLDELRKRPSISKLLNQAIFQRIILLKRDEMRHFHLEIINENEEKIVSHMVSKR